MKKLQNISDINTNSKEGRYLMAALAKITTESQTNKTPDKVLEQCYILQKKMFKGELKQKESPLNRPSAYHLIDIFKELKFGRPAASQQYLQKCIEELDGKKTTVDGSLPQKLREIIDNPREDGYWVKGELRKLLSDNDR